NNHINIYSTMIKEDLLDIVMPAHVIYKDIDPKAPATLSKVIINDIIRKQLNFKKVIISDCITMDALKNIPLDHVINQALAIGFDIVTVSHQSTDTIKSLIKQVQMNSDAAKERLSKLWVKPKNINPRAEIISTELGSKKIIFGTNKAV
ncbi:MAG: hypothetical protein HOI53_09895, partial [Francisellaceae bacterium]|nr:hypothetical protein [Francisellaceae bacterium]